MLLAWNKHVRHQLIQEPLERLAVEALSEGHSLADVAGFVFLCCILKEIGSHLVRSNQDNTTTFWPHLIEVLLVLVEPDLSQAHRVAHERVADGLSSCRGLASMMGECELW